MPADQFADLTVILPTLNEVGNLESLIDELGRELPGCQVIVVDDNSIRRHAGLGPKNCRPQHCGTADRSPRHALPH